MKLQMNLNMKVQLKVHRNVHKGWGPSWQYHTFIQYVAASYIHTTSPPPVAVQHISALQGTTAVLPCAPDDDWQDVFLLLWFRENATVPLHRGLDMIIFVTTTTDLSPAWT